MGRASWAAALCALLAACASVESDTRALLAAPELEGARWGLIVTDMEGDELLAIRADDRYLPASNVKLFTTAAAFRWLGDVAAPDREAGASARLEPRKDGPPDLALTGWGDATLGDGPDCQSHCLAELAEAIAAAGVTSVGDVIGDDRAFPDERWRPGWSWEDLQAGYGTAASALVVNDNALELVVGPGSSPGAPAQARWREGDGFYALRIEAVTSAAGGDMALRIERPPGARFVRLYGTVPADAGPMSLSLGVHDPALAAAWRLKRLLLARGVAVGGDARARHRPHSIADEPIQPEPAAGDGRAGAAATI
ncbi:MAG: D-alanyl-D-alanine carboxypeptidase, partial [Caulobacterales bacterium]|nr:D-alanyl-D-alanine carboxypeptidase [Caulobacterales bacterium]